jgi:hypothetical protein
MKSSEFCYWLQGYFELSPEGQGLSPEQTDIVKRHLALVFAHEIDPSYGPNQEKLQNIHDGKPPVKPSSGSGTLYRC